MTEPTVEQGSGCFGCGPQNPSGLHLEFKTGSSLTGALTAEAIVHLSSHFQGARGIVHGGVVATLMDEAMSKLNRPLAGRAVTRHLSVEYLRPAPTETTLRLVATHDRREGRKLFHTAILTDSKGHVLARAEALFILVAPVADGTN